MEKEKKIGLELIDEKVDEIIILLDGLRKCEIEDVLEKIKLRIGEATINFNSPVL